MRLRAPGLKVTTVHAAIVQAAEGGDGAAQGELGRVRIGFVDGEICPQDGQHELHQFFVFQDLCGCPTEASQFLHRLLGKKV